MERLIKKTQKDVETTPTSNWGYQNQKVQRMSFSLLFFFLVLSRTIETPNPQRNMAATIMLWVLFFYAYTTRFMQFIPFEETFSWLCLKNQSLNCTVSFYPIKSLEFWMVLDGKIFRKMPLNYLSMEQNKILNFSQNNKKIHLQICHHHISHLTCWL